MSDDFDFEFEDLPEEEAAQEEEYYDRRDYRARRKSLFTFYISAFFAVVVGALLLCIFVFFRVDTVKIIGGDSYRQEDILSVCNINEGDNLVLLTTKDREAELERRFPYIDSVKITKKIPSYVEVTITETKTAFSVEYAGGYLYVNHSGKVLEFAPNPCPGSAVIRGTTPTVQEPSEILSFAEEESALVFNEIISQLREKDVASITDVDLTNRYDVTMTYDGRVLFRFGNTVSMRYKMAFGLEVLKQLVNSGEITGETYAEIDLSVVPDKNKAFFREVIPGQEKPQKTEGVAGREVVLGTGG